MIHIEKLAQLTGIALSQQEKEILLPQLESVATFLDEIKEYELPQVPTQSWYELLGIELHPQSNGTPDSDPQSILANIQHPLVGNAIEVKAFVE